MSFGLALFRMEEQTIPFPPINNSFTNSRHIFLLKAHYIIISIHHYGTMSETRAPQLVFDDGSRVMTEEGNALAATATILSPRGSCSVKEYYEIDRLVAEIQSLQLISDTTAGGGWSVRVALQFPDDMLIDAADVCWEFETALNYQALVFCLADTTFAPCCPDAVAAAHLQADCMIHYGHACLSPCRDIPVLYSFGRKVLQVQSCVQAVVQESKQLLAEDGVQRILLLYQVCYHHVMEELQDSLKARGVEVVVIGKIPSPGKRAAALQAPSDCGKANCCSSATNNNDSVDETNSAKEPDQASTIETTNLTATEQNCDNMTLPTITPETFVVGGLEIPRGTDWSSHTLLYVGDDTSRQYLNIILRFLSGSGPARYWAWHPDTNTLSTTLSPAFQRRLNRRFYLVQKARQSAVLGILVASLSDTYMRTVVASLRHLIQKHDRTVYTMVVGKINPAKLANFGEIDCFCLVACPEHSLLDDDREYHVPVLTPLELVMALGDAEWGVTQYSLDIQDFLETAAAAAPGESTALTNDDEDDAPEDDDADAPYFSLITGRYESAPVQTAEGVDLAALPGQGQLAEYNSAAAAHLKQREYQGLVVQAGKTEVRAAVPGLQGIASNYGDR